MKLRTGIKTLIGISTLGIAVAVYEIFTCPLAALLSFSVAQFLGASEAGEHGPAISTLRGMPIHKSPVVQVEASFLVIPIFLAVIVLCFLILRRRGFQIMGAPITPRLLGLGVLLIALWNLFFSGVLFVERVRLHFVT